MLVVVLCGPPCSGKTALVHHIAHLGDVVLDYDTIARALGSPALWLHPEPWRSMAEQELQAQLAAAHTLVGPGTAWLLRTAPRPSSRADLASVWQADVWVLDPGERECRRRARMDGRPVGTGSHIGEWYHRYRPWSGDRDARELLR